MNLFAYGTLMWPDVIAGVIGRPVAGTPSRLDGVRRVRVRGEIYPALILSDGGCVDGVIYKNLSSAEMTLLDRFEGAEYVRRSVAMGWVCAETYFASEDAELEDVDWSPDGFSEEHMAAFCNEYKGWV